MKKTVVITGGTSGIGLATAKLLLQAGYYLILIGRSEEKFAACKPLLDDIDPTAYTFIAGDLQASQEVKALAEKILTIAPNIWGLVNNAGIYLEKNILDLTEEDFDTVMNTNLKGTFFLTKYLSPGFTDQGGSIVNVSSDAGINGNYNCTAYCSSKGALNLFTKSLALEWAYRQIRVNAVCPGDIDTPLTRAQFGANFDAEIAATAELYPLGRIGTSDEVANVIAFLISPQASFVTGAIWSIDGGLTTA